MARRRNLIIAGAVVFVCTFLITFVASSIFTKPEESDAMETVTLTDPVSRYYTSISSSSDTISLNAAPNRNDALAVATDTLTVTTNAGGYVLYIGTDDIGEESRNLYLDGDRSSDKYFRPTEEVSGATNLALNSWGCSIDGTNYKGVPAMLEEDVIDDKTGSYTPGVTVRNDYTISYAARVDYDLPPGSYQGTVAYGVATRDVSRIDVINVTPNEIYKELWGTKRIQLTLPLMTNMDVNHDWIVKIGAYDCTGVMGEKDEDDFVILSCSAPKTLGAGTYTVTASNPIFGDYSSEVDALTYTNVNDLYTIPSLQDMVAVTCAVTPTPNADATEVAHTDEELIAGGWDENELANLVPEIALRDERDGNVYRVRKLADGNCWMADDLKLVLTAGEAVDVYDYEARETIQWTPQNNTQVDDFDTAWSWEADYDTDHSAMTSTDGNYGIFYDWYAATAGGNNTDNIAPTTTLCPTNWRMPNVEGEVSFRNLAEAYSINETMGSHWLQEPLVFLYSGYYYSSGGKTAPYNRGVRGYYWTNSSVEDNADNAYSLRLYATSSQVGYSSGKHFGDTVRCVLEHDDWVDEYVEAGSGTGGMPELMETFGPEMELGAANQLKAPSVLPDMSLSPYQDYEDWLSFGFENNAEANEEESEEEPEAETEPEADEGEPESEPETEPEPESEPETEPEPESEPEPENNEPEVGPDPES